MLRIERTRQFKKDYKREMQGKHRTTLKPLLAGIVSKLVREQTLAKRYRDHALSGNWKDHRDCYLKPDLILIYRKQGNDSVQLVRLGSHSELGI